MFSIKSCLRLNKFEIWCLNLGHFYLGRPFPYCTRVLGFSLAVIPNNRIRWPTSYEYLVQLPADLSRPGFCRITILSNITIRDRKSQSDLTDVAHCYLQVHTISPYQTGLRVLPSFSFIYIQTSSRMACSFKDDRLARCVFWSIVILTAAHTQVGFLPSRVIFFLRIVFKEPSILYFNNAFVLEHNSLVLYIFLNHRRHNIYFTARPESSKVFRNLHSWRILYISCISEKGFVVSSWPFSLHSSLEAILLPLVLEAM
jgi:hypothetical protein